MAVGKGEGLLDEACQDGGVGGAFAVFLVEEAYAVLREGYGADLGGGLYVEKAGQGAGFEGVGRGLFLVAVGAPAAYFGLHLGRAGTVEPRDVRFLFCFGLHLVGVGRFP